MMAVMGVLNNFLGIGVPQIKFELLRGSATFFGAQRVSHREKG
jgi:hypothetical protein